MSETWESLRAVAAPALVIVLGMAVLLMDLGGRKASLRGLIPGVALVGLFTAAVISLGGALAARDPIRIPNLAITAFGGGMVYDSLSGFLSFVVCLVAGAALAMGSDYIEERGLPRGEFFALVLFSASGALLMAQSLDLVNLFVGLEVLSVALYILAGYARKDRKSEEAAVKYFLLGAFASGFLLYGIALIYGAVGMSARELGVKLAVESFTNLQSVEQVLRQSSGTAHALGASPLFVAGVALLLVGLGFKAALVPFHSYAPDVYEGAPAPVTAFMSSAAKIGAFAGLLRLAQALAVPGGATALMPVLWGIALATMLVGNVMAIRQTNVKRLLAYSSVAHAGYIAVGLLASLRGGVNPDLGNFPAEAVRFYLLAYSLTNIGAFAVVLWLGREGSERTELADYRGLARRHPWAAAALTIFLLSLAGVPLTVGFLGKLYLFLAAMQAGLPGLAIAGLLLSVVGVYYYLNWIVALYFHEPSAERPPIREGGAKLVAALAAIAVVALGLIPLRGLSPVPPTSTSGTVQPPAP